jgi:hypothetical protein
LAASALLSQSSRVAATEALPRSGLDLTEKGKLVTFQDHIIECKFPHG